MQPLKLTIPGQYWDSQLYAGRLYLFRLDGALQSIDWDQVIESWELPNPLRLAMECAFRRSDYLYGSHWSLAFSDEEIKAIIRQKFDRLSGIDLELSATRLNEASIATQDSPFPFPHVDCTIYKQNMFVATGGGLFRATCNKRTRKPVSSRPEKYWDAPTHGLAASYNTLALAAGDEGLFEFNLDSRHLSAIGQNGPALIANRNCTDCSWTFYSVFCSSHLNSGFLASYKKEVERYDTTSFRRVFEEVIPGEDIFGHRGYCWGSQDKICQVQGNAVRITRYAPWAYEKQERLENLGSIDLNVDTITLARWKGGVVSGAVSVFGTIIECENAIVMVPSEGSPITLPGEPVNWRVFPRSVQYENQLHVVYSDRLEIFSFNQDYFVDQTRKLSGTRFSTSPYRSANLRGRTLPRTELL